MALGRQIRAGAAFIELTLSDSKLMKGLRGAEARMKSFGRQAMLIGGAITAVGTATLGVLGKFTQKFAEAGDQLNKMSARTGFSVEALSSLGFAAEQGGASIDLLENALKGMARFSVNAERGLSTATDTLDMLGVSIDQFESSNPEERFLLLAQALSEVEDPTKRAGLAMQVFGRAGREMLPMLANGRAGIEQLQAEAHRLGITLTEEDAAAAAELTDAMNRLKRQLGAVIVQIGSALAPVLTEMQGKIAPIVKRVIDWVKSNKELIVTVAKLAAGVTAAGAGIVALGVTAFSVGSIFGVLAGAVSLAGTAIGILGGILAAVMSPIGAVAAAVIGVIASFTDWESAAASAKSTIGSAFETLKSDAESAWGGIKDAIQAGDLELAFRIVGAAIQLEWVRVMNKLRALLQDFLDGARQSVSSIPGLGLVSKHIGVKGVDKGNEMRLTAAEGDFAKAIEEARRAKVQKALSARGRDLSEFVGAGEILTPQRAEDLLASIASVEAQEAKAKAEEDEFLKGFDAMLSQQQRADQAKQREEQTAGEALAAQDKAKADFHKALAEMGLDDSGGLLQSLLPDSLKEAFGLMEAGEEVGAQFVERQANVGASLGTDAGTQAVLEALRGGPDMLPEQKTEQHTKKSAGFLSKIQKDMRDLLAQLNNAGIVQTKKV